MQKKPIDILNLRVEDIEGARPRMRTLKKAEILGMKRDEEK
jgi:hypothetical protein